MNPYFTSAVQKFESKNYSAALVDFEKAVKAEPRNFAFILGRARAKFKLERFEDSLLDFDKALTINASDANTYSERAVTYVHLSRFELALQDFNKAQIIEPQNPYRYSSRAYIKAKIGDLKGAMADYQKAVELDPEDAIAMNNLGMLEEQMGYESAKERMKKADELAKDFFKDMDEFEQKEQAQHSKTDKENAQIEPKNSFPEIRKINREKRKSYSWKDHFKIVFEIFNSKTVFAEFITFVKNKFGLK
ncbi:MAG: tetratricopeptide repeat protein [Bacteroidetes bacterium]|nr:MAG: tetratricopeptide repeat protein [Bacteroidota bacterium]